MKKNGAYLITVLLYLVCVTGVASALPAPDSVGVHTVLGTNLGITVPFVENRGQIKNGDVGFYAHVRGGTLFVGNTGEITYNLSLGEKKGLAFREIISEKKNKPSGASPSTSMISFFKGKELSAWKTNIPSYQAIDGGEVYKNITLTLRAYQNNVEKIFTVLPGGKPEHIIIKLAGITGLVVNESDELEVMSEGGTARFTAPVAYQMKDGKKQFVDVAYAVTAGSNYGFKVGSYDTKIPLIIDPLLASTLIGAGNNDFCWSVAIDGNNNTFVTSNTTSMDFPTTLGAYDESYNGGIADIYVAKFDSTLTNLLACTFLGGVDRDTSFRITVDNSGNVLVTGDTQSSDFPVTPGAYTSPARGGKDAYIALFDNTLSTLIASAIIGGSDNESGYDILLDDSENVIITGYTESADYPSTSGAYDQGFNGVSDVIISKFDHSLSSLLASSFLGGDGEDSCTGITFDGDGNILMTGAAGDNFPTTPGAWNRTYSGGGEAFVARLDKTFSTLMASTYIGGSDNEYGYTVKVNASGEIYMAGELWSDDYPTTPDAYDPTFNGGVMDAMLSKFDSSLSTLLASTFLGGSEMDWHHHNLLIDAEGNVYVNGLTKSADFPTTPDAEKRSKGPDFTVFITKFDADLHSILHSTFFGGDSVGNGSLDMVFDPDFNIYIAGWTTSDDFPTTSGAYDESHNGGMDVFVSKLCFYGTPANIDCDSIPDAADNCPLHMNPGQEDTLPPPGNNCGDACECEGNFDDDLDVDGSDASTFKADFGRNVLKNPCTNALPCNGDFECDTDVDGTNASTFKSDFGRSALKNPCPICPTDPWCSYPY